MDGISGRAHGALHQCGERGIHVYRVLFHNEARCVLQTAGCRNVEGGSESAIHGIAAHVIHGMANSECRLGADRDDIRCARLRGERSHRGHQSRRAARQLLHREHPLRGGGECVVPQVHRGGARMVCRALKLDDGAGLSGDCFATPSGRSEALSTGPCSMWIQIASDMRCRARRDAKVGQIQDGGRMARQIVVRWSPSGALQMKARQAHASSSEIR